MCYLVAVVTAVVMVGLLCYMVALLATGAVDRSVLAVRSPLLCAAWGLQLLLCIGGN